MLFIEFKNELSAEIVLKYRNVDGTEWYYMQIDIETLALLVENFGVISTVRVPTKSIIIDTPLTGEEISVSYCGANIKFYCRSNSQFNISKIEQNY